MLTEKLAFGRFAEACARVFEWFTTRVFRTEVEKNAAKMACAGRTSQSAGSWVRLIRGSEMMRNQPTDHVRTCLIGISQGYHSNK